LPASLFVAFAFKKSEKISARSLENFTRCSRVFWLPAVPLSRALVILYKEASTPATTAKWKEIHDLVVDGMSLADAMAKSPDTFPRVYTAMVQAARRAAFSTLCWRRSPIFRHAKKSSGPK